MNEEKWKHYKPYIIGLPICAILFLLCGFFEQKVEVLKYIKLLFLGAFAGNLWRMPKYKKKDTEEEEREK